MSGPEERRITEEQLVLFHYGEPPYHTPEARREMKEQLAASEEVRASYQAMQDVLGAVNALPVPERDAFYGQRVWRHVEERLAESQTRNWRAWLMPRRLALVASLAVLLVAAFFAGRFWPSLETSAPTNTAAVVPPQPAEVRERILMVAVGDHLERSQMILVELVNADPKDGFDLAVNREQAEELVADNRLYRQVAEDSGERGMANVLDELERILLEIARGPSKLTSAELQQIQKRIESQGILFKVRVIGSEVRDEHDQKPPEPPPANGSLGLS